jgi:hypothetical protein
MVNWHVISDLGMVHSAIAPGTVLGCPYLFCAGKTQMGIEDTAMAGGRVWIAIPQDGNLFSETRWKWNLRWEPLMKTRDDLLTDAAPAVTSAWGIPVVFIKTAGEGRIYYSSYDLGVATQWREVGGVTDQPLAAASTTFNGKTYLYVFRRNPTDGFVYFSRTADKGEAKTWETWRAIPGDLRTKKSPAAAAMIAPNGKMLFVFAKREGTNRLAFSATLDGMRWSAWRDISIDGKPIEMVGPLAPTVVNYEESLYLPFIPAGVDASNVEAAVLSPVFEGNRVVNAAWSRIDFCPIPTDFDQWIAVHGYHNSESSHLYTIFHGRASNVAVVSHAETVKPAKKK